ncbi:MAG: hypothetical protein ACTSUE_12030 [Promethearchaeota archaeon]
MTETKQAPAGSTGYCPRRPLYGVHQIARDVKFETRHGTAN